MLAALPPPFTAATDRAPESPTGSDEASGCAVDLQRLEQRRTSTQLPRCKVYRWRVHRLLLTVREPLQHISVCRQVPHVYSILSSS